MIGGLARRFARPLRFAAVGGTGFVVDAGLTETLVRLGGDPYVVRVFAVAVAMAVTYALNRRFTFRAGPRRPGERSQYVAVSLVATAINYLVYALMIATLPGITPALAVAAGVAVGMNVNYFGYSRLVFRPEAPADRAGGR